MNNKSILTTGYKGFIGKRLFYYPMTGYDLIDGNDIRDKYKLEQYFKRLNFDTVIHLAARAGVRDGEMYPEEYISTNVNGTLNLLNLSKKYGIKHFIFFSSSAIYGNQESPNSELAPLKPIGVYGSTKAMGEMLVQGSGVPYTIIRPFTVYGENGRLDQVIFKWINQIKLGLPITIYGDGSSKRGYTYIGDLVDGVGKILETGADNITYNLGGNEIISLNELIDLFKPYTDNFEWLSMPLEDIKENWANIQRAEINLNWKPQTDFKLKVKEILKNEFGK